MKTDKSKLIKSILTKFGVPFIEHHPEVSFHCIGVHCPYCHDKDFHCGIFREKGSFYCWKCTQSGSFLQLMYKITGATYNELSLLWGKEKPSEDSVKKNLDNIFSKDVEEEEEVAIEFPTMEMAKAWMAKEKQLITRFLKDRNFTTKQLFNYDCYVGFAGRYINRLCIPIDNGFIARDLTNKADKKYIFPKGFKAHNHLYRSPLFLYQEIPDTIILVEGVFDLWAVDAVSDWNIDYAAILGKQFTKAQLNLLFKNHTYKNVIIMLDGDAHKAAEKIRRMIDPFFDSVKIARLPKHEDPCSFDRIALKHLIEEVTK